MRSDAEQGGSAAVREAIGNLGRGQTVMLVDPLHDCGYLASAASQITGESLAWMARHGRGVVRVAMGAERLRDLELPRMETGGDERFDYHVPVDVDRPTRSEPAASDATVIRALADPTTRPEDLLRPGRVFCVASDPLGVLGRLGAAEAAVELMNFAGAGPIAVLYEASDEGGGSADADSARQLGTSLSIRVVDVADVMLYREDQEPRVNRVTEVRLPTASGLLEVAAFVGRYNTNQYFVFHSGGLKARRAEVYVHVRCHVSDVFGGVACECGERLQAAIGAIHHSGGAAVVYVAGNDTHGMRHLLGGTHQMSGLLCERDVAAILRSVGATSVWLSSNEAVDMSQLRHLGIDICSCEAAEPDAEVRVA